MRNDLPILYAEDDEHDVFLLQRAFREAGVANPIQVARDGVEAMEYLSGKGEFGDRERFPLPTLMILDLKMPRADGLEVLEWLRGQESPLVYLPVIMLSSSGHEGDVERAYRSGVNSFVVKPSGVEGQLAFARAVRDYWLEFSEVSSTGLRWDRNAA